MNNSTIKRFWAKVKKTSGCWLWTGSKRNKGYGAFVWADKGGRIIQGRAHRFSWEIHNGPVPQGLNVLHNCPGGDNPACINPAHLWLGTKAENNADMVAKGRHVPGGNHCGEDGCWPCGEEHHAAKLTPKIVLAIREDKERGMSYSQLAKKYHHAIGSLHRIVTRKAWKHVK